MGWYRYAPWPNLRSIARPDRHNRPGGCPGRDRRIPHGIESVVSCRRARVALEKDLEGAIKKLDKAIDLNPNDAEMYRQRAQWKLFAQRFRDGLNDCDSARRVAKEQHIAKKSGSEFLEEVAVLRSQFLQHLNRHQEAVALWTQLVQDTDRSHNGRLASRLNGLAYARALGKIELDMGLAEADEALELLGNRAVLLDPGGYLYFGCGCTVRKSDPKLALSSLNEAAERAEKVYRHNEKRAKALESRLRSSYRYEERLKVLRPHLAGIYRLRSDLLHDLGRAKDAERDRARIADLAPNGNVSVAAPVDLVLAIQRVMSGLTTLDTRGFLYYQLGDFESARSDVEKAVEMSEWIEKAFPWYVESRRYTILDMRPLMIAQEGHAFTTAVIRYHRMLVYESLGMKKEAEEDRRTICESGFEPGDSLF